MVEGRKRKKRGEAHEELDKRGNQQMKNILSDKWEGREKGRSRRGGRRKRRCVGYINPKAHRWCTGETGAQAGDRESKNKSPYPTGC